MQNMMVPMIMLATFATIAVGVLLESTTLARAVIKNLLVVGGVVVLMLIAGALTM